MRKIAIGEIATIGGIACMLWHCASVPRDANDPYHRAASSMGVVQPRTEVERSILKNIAQFQPNSEKRVGNCRVLVESPYSAASGRHCRRVRLTCDDDRGGKSGPEGGVRLACQSGGTWGVYVPDVFPQSSDESHQP